MVQEQALLNNILLFTRTLHQAGLPVSTSQTMAFCRSIELIDISSKDQFYHAARSLLVTRKEHIQLFDTIFNVFWRKPPTQSRLKRQKSPLAPRHKRPKQHAYNLAMLMARKAESGDKEIELGDKTHSFTDAEILQRKAFSQMSPAELDTIKQLLQQMRWSVSLRRTRRFVPDKSGQQLHLRRMMRAAVQHGGTPIKMAYRERKIKQRPIVLIADISGSMEKYSRLVLQFFYCLSHSLKDVESFVFGTRLTRITGQLKLKNIDRAIEDAAREVVDWSGGTRIGDSLKSFNQQWSRRVLRRGAIAIVISDGWERGAADLLASEMRYLQHRSHRLIWLNPLSGQAAYRPTVEGMAQALPYIDDFLPIHNLQSLEELASHLAKLD